jgi:hypothetical protein
MYSTSSKWAKRLSLVDGSLRVVSMMAAAEIATTLVLSSGARLMLESS